MREDNNIDRTQEPDSWDAFLSWATEVRKTDLYKGFKHRMMREVKDWRKEFYDFYCRWQDDRNSKEIKSEALAWFILLYTDREYHRNGQFELPNDLEDYITNNGVRIDAVRYSEWIKWFKDSLAEQTTQTIDKDGCLLKAFDNNNVYGLFIERCKNQKDIDVINELLGAFGALYKDWKKVIRAKKITLKSVHYNLTQLGLTRIEYNTFHKDLKVEGKTNAFQRNIAIDKAKREYLKLIR